MKTGRVESGAGHDRPDSRVTARLAAILAVVALAGSGSTACAVPSLQYETGVTLPHEADRGTLAVSVTAAMDGSICVTDATTHSGHLIDSRNVHVFGTAETAGLADPTDITLDTTGGFVCTDIRAEGGRTLRRLDFFGFPVAYEPVEPIERWQPDHLLVTRDGGFVTTDATNGILAKHDAATGALLWKQEIGEEDVIAIGRPAEAPDGRLFLPLPGDHQVRVLSATGETESSFGTPGGTHGRLSFPVGVAFTPDGFILVVDRMRHVILLYDDGYRFISEFGTFGLGPTDLYFPNSITATPDGRVYVAQAFQRPVQEYRFISSESVPEQPAMSSSSQPGARNGSTVPVQEGEEVPGVRHHASGGLEPQVGELVISPTGSDVMEARQ